jgi:hypothetical protein
MMEKSVEGLPVVVVQFAKIKIFRGLSCCVIWIGCVILHLQ